MTTIAESARVTTKAANLTSDIGLVWTRLDKAAHDANGTYSEYGGAPGRLVRTTLKSIIESLYPQVTMLDEQERKGFESPIYTALRQSRNAMVKERGGIGRPSVWWVAETFTPVNLLVLSQGCGSANSAPTNGEKKLSSHEAGEDRTPGEVTTAMTSAIGQTKPETDELRARIFSLLKLFTEPITEDELRVALDLPYTSFKANGAPSKNGSLTSVLRTLCDGKQIYSRLETIDERRVRAGLFAPQTPYGRGALLYASTRSLVKRPRETKTLVDGYVFEPGVMSYEGNKAAAAKKREERNQRVLNALITLGRPVSALVIGELISISDATATEACKYLMEAGLVHTAFDNRVRVYASIDVPFGRIIPPTAAPPVKETPTMMPAGLTATENGVVLVARGLPSREFTAHDLAEESGRSESKCGDVLRRHTELFEKIGVRNRRNVYRFRNSGLAAIVPPPSAPPAPAIVVKPDVLEQIRQLVSGADQSAQVADLERENADLREQLRKTKAALAAALGA